MNHIEREIVRASCYYNYYNILLSTLMKDFVIDTSTRCVERFAIKVRTIIIRWLFILVMDRVSNDDPVFISSRSADLETQIRIDIKNFFGLSNPNNIDLNVYSTSTVNILYSSFRDYKKLIDDTKLKKDGKVIITKDSIIYKSSTVKKIQDRYVETKNNMITLKYYSDRKYLNCRDYDINKVFAAYFRYKYLYADNQTLAYTYTDDRESSMECFSTPFNHYYNYFCTAFPDLESEMGSQGEFFDIMNKAIKNEYTFPVNVLKINPIFDEIVDLRVSEISLRLLDSGKKYIMSFILPNWSNFEAVELLLNSKYFIKKEVLKKGQLPFTNYFTGNIIYPCDIIIIYLQN